MPERRGLCLVVAAPSGAGKSTITRALLATEPQLSLSVSATTRPARPGEQEGEHYYFRTPSEFRAMVEKNELLEWAEVFSRRYGTPRGPVERALGAGRDVAFDVDWQGHRQLKAALPEDVLSVFILPPSLEALESRLRKRGGDDAAEIARRMDAARSEISHWAEFDYVVVNDNLDHAIDSVRSVLHAGRVARVRQPGLPAFVERLG